MNTPRLHRWPLALAAALAFTLAGSFGATTRVLPFQGRLTDASGNSIADGARVVQFKIYDAPVGGRAVWNGEVQNLTVNAGLVSTLLGTKASIAGLDFNQDLYLELTIDANGDGQIGLADPPLLPRQSILPAVFSRESGNSRFLQGYDWSPLFGTNNPADGTLLDSKIGEGAVTTPRIRDAAVTTAKIADGAVTRPKLDTAGASAGQSLVFNGTQAVWSEVNAIDAAKLAGFDWTSLFNNGNPQNGQMSVANLVSRGGLDVNGNLFVRGTAIINGQTIFQATVIPVAIGGNPRLDGNFFLNDNFVFLRGVGDRNHYLRWANSFHDDSNPFDGPLLVGNVGGALGTTANWTLRWNRDGNVRVRGSYLTNCDRNAKENFTDVNPAEVLAKVAAMPITRWNYRNDSTSKHIGPVAQDFRAAFGLGLDDKSIATVDADGVALAAIQGLNQKVDQTDNELRKLLRQQFEQIETLRAEIAALKARRQ